MIFNRISVLILLVGTLIFSSCEENNTGSKDNFDRKESLAYIADNIIIPAWEEYVKSLETLVISNDEFYLDPSINTFNSLKSAFKNSWLAWQDVAMFEIGKGENITIRNFTNIYPTDNEQIIQNIENQNYNLILPSTYDEQGFPALDYLLHGLENSDQEIIVSLTQTNYKNYLSELITKLHEMGNSVLLDWNSDFRSEFVENDGSSGTASYDLLVNDFLFYYEKFLRAGKVGIPAGVFSVNPLPQNVEAFYNQELNKDLFNQSLSMVERFFLGISFDENTTGNSLSQYLDYISELNNIDNLNESIISNWEGAHQLSANLNDNFSFQVESDNVKMLELFDQLQKNVVLLKVDMLQQLNIQVDFIDADGD